MDLAMVFYTYVLIVALLGYGIFLVNMLRIGRTNIVYVYVMTMFGSIAYTIGLSVYVRNMIDSNPTAYWEFLRTTIWNTRVVPLALVMTVFVIHMYWRFFIGRAGLEEKYSETEYRKK